jgi:hypothetical protein
VEPWAIDLAFDCEQWPDAPSPADKAPIYSALSSLMVAEERITTKFAGLVTAADSEEEASFLASQQVDEARHMQFYVRFQDEFIAEPTTIAGHIAPGMSSTSRSPSSSTKRSSQRTSDSPPTLRALRRIGPHHETVRERRTGVGLDELRNRIHQLGELTQPIDQEIVWDALGFAVLRSARLHVR